jgi:hypothetical protein
MQEYYDPENKNTNEILLNIKVNETTKNKNSKFTDGSYTVGQTVVLLEPVYLSKKLGKEGNLPILEIQERFEPYEFSWIVTITYTEPEEVCTTY